MLVFSLARAPLSVSQDATRAESLLHYRSPSDDYKSGVPHTTRYPEDMIVGDLREKKA